MIDASLPKRLANHLTARKREAVSAAALGIADLKDPPLLRELASWYNGKRPWVLVTGDDVMPAEHGPVIIAAEATIATIHPEYPSDMTEHHWEYDVVQRWAHAMQEQKPETVRRYDLRGSRPWKPRRRHIRQIAWHGWTPWRSEDVAQARAARRAQSSAGPKVPEPDLQERFPGVG